VTAGDFRKLALGFPHAVESAHMDHPDFRVGGKIFASLAPTGSGWGMVKLTPDQQAAFVRAEPNMFEPFNGAWGRQGCTKVHLKAARKAVVRQALAAAWCSTAPKKLVEQHEE